MEKEYFVYGSQHYIIKNKQLLFELNMKLKRILSFEKSKIKQTGNPYFEQRIYDIYSIMLAENSLFNKLQNKAERQENDPELAERAT